MRRRVPASETREIEQIRASHYGVRTKRTLDQPGRGNLRWVPYDESPDYGV